MAIIGISILIVSISFLCYRHPPTWDLRAWFQRVLPSLALARGRTEEEEEESESVSPSTRETEDDAEKEEKVERVTSPVPVVEAESNVEDKQERDRKAMPPPQLPTLKKPTGDTTPKATAAKPSSTIPSLSIGGDNDEDDDEEEDYTNDAPPSFPALNSAQRASGGSMAPPRLPVLRNSAGLSSGSAPLPGRGSMPPPPRLGASSLSPPSRGPIPQRGPLPNRGPPTSSSSLAPPPSHSAVPTKPSRKVLLTPGHSPLDWARLSASPTANLRGIDPSLPYIKVPPSLLKQMNGRKGRDAWTILGGRVYNITPYVPYHPGGGPELLRCAGKDGTRLFAEVHPWVNWEGMLEACLVGIPVEEGEADVSILGGQTSDGQGQRKEETKAKESWLEEMD